MEIGDNDSTTYTHIPDNERRSVFYINGAGDGIQELRRRRPTDLQASDDGWVTIGWSNNFETLIRSYKCKKNYGKEAVVLF